MAKRPPREGEGRPSIYTKELADTICDRIAHGESVRRICRDDAMPDASTIYLWLLDEDKKEFFKHYEEAKNIQAELMFEELLEIADDSSRDTQINESQNGGTYETTNHEVIGRSRLRVDTRKWYLSKVLPKKFGEKLDMTSGGEKIATGVIVLPQRENENTLATPAETSPSPSE